MVPPRRYGPSPWPIVAFKCNLRPSVRAYLVQALTADNNHLQQLFPSPNKLLEGSNK
jgi:hypothetical protein